MNSPSTLFTRTASDEESHTLLPKAGGAAAKRSHHLAGVALVVMAMAAGAGYSTIKAASRVATSFDAVEPVDPVAATPSPTDVEWERTPAPHMSDLGCSLTPNGANISIYPSNTVCQSYTVAFSKTCDDDIAYLENCYDHCAQLSPDGVRPYRHAQTGWFVTPFCSSGDRVACMCANSCNSNNLAPPSGANTFIGVPCGEARPEYVDPVPAPAIARADDIADDPVPYPTAAPTLAKEPSLYDVISDDVNFSMLKLAVDTSRLTPLFKGEGKPINLTLFGPTNTAFSKLGVHTFENLLADQNKLINVLTYHLLPKKFPTDELSVGSYATLYGGAEIEITAESPVTINAEAAVIPPANQTASNGILQPIDAVLTKFLDDAGTRGVRGLRFPAQPSRPTPDTSDWLQGCDFLLSLGVDCE